MAIRTEQEVLAHYLAQREGDFFGWQSEVLVPYLPFDLAKPFLNEGVTAEDWGTPHPLEEPSILGHMREYMVFAWEKVEGHRGISANRSVEKMRAWTWLLGRDDVLTAIDQAGYAPYGAPQLRVVCGAFGFPIPEDERLRRMMAGKSCSDGCDEGCG